MIILSWFYKYRPEAIFRSMRDNLQQINAIISNYMYVKKSYTVQRLTQIISNGLDYKVLLSAISKVQWCLQEEKQNNSIRKKKRYLHCILWYSVSNIFWQSGTDCIIKHNHFQMTCKSSEINSLLSTPQANFGVLLSDL